MTVGKQKGRCILRTQGETVLPGIRCHVPAEIWKIC